jgi:hypothetical protein
MRTERDDDNLAGDCMWVVWCHVERRCELWMVSGNQYLRLFDGETLVTEEPVVQGAVWAQALALKTWRPGRRQRYQFGFRERP